MLGVLAASLISSTMLCSTNAFARGADYDFEITGHPSASTVAVALVDAATHKIVPDARIFVLRWAYGFGKGEASHQVRTPLKAGQDGSFVADGLAGDQLQFVAVVSGASEPVSGSVLIPTGP